MATVFDVAKYILDKYGAMSAMKLQKLTFYSQAMSLVWDDIPLFDDEFEAWAKGPVCYNLWKAHKGMFMLENSDFLQEYNPNIDNLTSEQKETIDVVLSSLKNLSPYQLSEMTHSELPWKEARKNCEKDTFCRNIISKETMQNYYAENW